MRMFSFLFSTTHYARASAPAKAHLYRCTKVVLYLVSVTGQRHVLQCALTHVGPWFASWFVGCCNIPSPTALRGGVTPCG